MFSVIVVLLGFLSIGVFFILMVKAAFCRQWKELCKLARNAFVSLCLMVAAGWALSEIEYAWYLKSVLGEWVWLSEPVFQYDSERSFLGDGYSITVYELPNSLRRRFETADQRTLEERPKLPLIRSQWKARHWRPTPADDSKEDFSALVLSEFDPDGRGELTRQLAELEIALRRPGSFFAYLYNNPLEHISDIDFFLVDLVGGKLYVINHNT